MKVVINKRHGGFGLSEQAVIEYFKIKRQPLWVVRDSKYGSLGIVHYWVVPEHERLQDAGDDWFTMSLEQRQEYNRKWSEQTFSETSVARDDPILVQVIETIGSEKASSKYAELQVVEIPDDVEWQIEEYDGLEWIAEKHRTWS